MYNANYERNIKVWNIKHEKRKACCEICVYVSIYVCKKGSLFPNFAINESFVDEIKNLLIEDHFKRVSISYWYLI